MICVDFVAKGCQPCEKSAPFWESLVPKYPTCSFYVCDCDQNSSDAKECRIKATPTFLFVLKGNEIARYEGCEKEKIIATLEEHKPPGDFAGQSRTLSIDPSSPPPAALPPETEKKARTVIPENMLPNPKKKKDLVDELVGMNFSENQINSAIAALGVNASIDDYVSNIVEQQSKPKERTLNEQETRQFEDLVSMGYSEELSVKAILKVGADSIDRLIQYITDVQNGKDPAAVPPLPTGPTRSKEELEAAANALREKSKTKVEDKKPDVKKVAMSELERRKQVQDQLEQKKKFDEMKKEQELREKEKERLADKLAKDKIKAKIAAQRKEQSGAVAKPVETPDAPPSSGQKSTINHCILKLKFPDNTSKQLTFQPTDTLNTVVTQLRTEKLISGKVQFEITFPRSTLGPDTFSRTLLDLQLCPRAQLDVKTFP